MTGARVKERSAQGSTLRIPGAGNWRANEVPANAHPKPADTIAPGGEDKPQWQDSFDEILVQQRNEVDKAVIAAHIRLRAWAERMGKEHNEQLRAEGEAKKELRVQVSRAEADVQRLQKMLQALMQNAGASKDDSGGTGEASCSSCAPLPHQANDNVFNNDLPFPPLDTSHKAFAEVTVRKYSLPDFSQAPEIKPPRKVHAQAPISAPQMLDNVQETLARKAALSKRNRAVRSYEDLDDLAFSGRSPDEVYKDPDDLRQAAVSELSSANWEPPQLIKARRMSDMINGNQSESDTSGTSDDEVQSPASASDRKIVMKKPPGGTNSVVNGGSSVGKKLLTIAGCDADKKSMVYAGGFEVAGSRPGPKSSNSLSPPPMVVRKPDTRNTGDSSARTSHSDLEISSEASQRISAVSYDLDRQSFDIQIKKSLSTQAPFDNDGGRNASKSTADGWFRSSSKNTGSRRPSLAPRVSEVGLRPSRNIFVNPEDVKETVREAIHTEEYNVKDLYSKNGVFQKLARSYHFENVTLIVITINALWMGIDTDLNKAPLLRDSHPVFQFMEHCMCAFFTVELLIRFMAFERKRDSFTDQWFVFDFMLVVMMVFETWIVTVLVELTTTISDGNLKNASILRLLRLMRLARMARLMRLIRAMPELMILIKGMAMATRSVFLTIFLLGVVTYVFGIALTTLTEDTDVGRLYWRSVLESMKTLVLHGCFLEGLPEVVNDTGNEHIAYGAIVMVFVFLASMTIMNMLVGVLVEVVSCVASIEKETLHVEFVKQKVQEALQQIGADNSCLTQEEFEAMLALPVAARALQDVGVDVVGLVDFCDFIFSGTDAITFAEFMETVLQLRGSNKATVKDLVDLRKAMMRELSSIERSFIDALGKRLSVAPKDAAGGAKTVAEERSRRQRRTWVFVPP